MRVSGQATYGVVGKCVLDKSRFWEEGEGRVLRCE
jgi:hypothetical protein